MKSLFKAENDLDRVIYRSFISLAAILVLFSGIITVWNELGRQKKEVNNKIMQYAAYVASQPGVERMLQSGYPDPEVTAAVNLFCESMPEISVAVIYNSAELRFYHTDRLSVGEIWLDGSEEPILRDADPYVAEIHSTKGTQQCAFHPVVGEAGSRIGFVVIAVPASMIRQGNRNITLLHMLIFLFMMLPCVVLTGKVVEHIRNSMRGYSPDELIRMYTRQDDVLNSLEEGLIVLDKAGGIKFFNEQAGRLLAEGREPAALGGMNIEAFYPQSSYRDVLATGKAVRQHTIEHGEHTLLVKEVPFRDSGVMIVLQDHTETLRLSDELSGARSMMDTLRAFNHEFLNKLHIILGYLQIGEIEEAKRFITNSSMVSSQMIRQTANCIRDARICALVIGKIMHAGELGISLSLTPDSRVHENDLLISEDDCVTVIGNLLENAIEELSAAGGQEDVKEIMLGLYFQRGVNIIICEDTGRGIDPRVAENLFESGSTTKGEGHGNGLYLVNRIVRNNRGEITVESEPGEGAVFTVTFSEEKEKEDAV